MPTLPKGFLKKKARNSSDDPEEFRAPLGDHLEELRTRLTRSLLLLALGWTAGWVLEPHLYSILNRMIQETVVPVVTKSGSSYSEAFRNATEPFFLKLKLSFVIGLILVFPFIVLQLWGFVKPALKKRERRPFRIIGPVSLLLFFMGSGFCWLVLPSALKWFASFVDDFPGTNLIQEPGALIFFILKMMLAFGIGFQLPIVVYGLGAVGLISSEGLMKNWRQAMVFIFIGAATLTPSSDAFSMLMMAIPLCVLFMLSVYFVRITQRMKADELDDEDGD